jgi:hypothetical protein
MFLLAMLCLGACQKEKLPEEAAVFGPAMELVALTENNELLLINAAMPGNSGKALPVSQLPLGEKLLSIDFRPATGELYALGASSRIYIINRDNGKARTIGAASFSPALSGNGAQIDFNPTVDRIRLVGNNGQNLRLNPETSAVVAVDGNINGAPATIEGIGYTNSMAGAATTTLYDIDFKMGMLYKQDPPNNGGLVAVGSLGITGNAGGGFDIAADNNMAIAVVSGKNSSKLYLIELMSGKASARGAITATVLDIAVPTAPVAYAITANNQLHIFNPTMPSVTIAKNIAGLQPEETLLGIDFRPVNAQLYGLGSTGRLYTINLSSGAAAAVGAPIATALMGTDFGFDFNPLVDRIRVVSNAGQNLRLNPNDGTLAATDGMLNPATPMVSAAAYTNNFAGTTTTELLVLDHSTGSLLLQNPPNAGTLLVRGSLGFGFTGSNGFDIGSRNNAGWAILTQPTGNMLMRINLADGTTSNAQSFPLTVKGLAIGTGF